MTLRSTMVIVALVVTACGASFSYAAIPLCAGDSWQESFSNTINVDSTTLRIRTRSTVSHPAPHPNCSYGSWPPVGAKATLSTSLFGSCETAVYTVGHDESAVVERDCTGLTEGCYTTRGSHYYNDTFDKHSYGGQKCITGGGSSGQCSFNGCSAPGWTKYLNLCSQPDIVDECDCCRRDTTPIIVDRSGDGMHLSSAANGALFEINGPFAPPMWIGWPLTSDDAWLAMDRTDNGMIDDGSELFGSATPLYSGGVASTGYEALGDLDDNGDGWIDAADSAFPQLRLWADADRNGVSIPRELLSLSDAGIVRLSINPSPRVWDDGNGNQFRGCAVVVATPVLGAAKHRLLSCDVYPDLAPAMP